MSGQITDSLPLFISTGFHNPISTTTTRTPKYLRSTRPKDKSKHDEPTTGSRTSSTTTTTAEEDDGVGVGVIAGAAVGGAAVFAGLAAVGSGLVYSAAPT